MLWSRVSWFSRLVLENSGDLTLQVLKICVAEPSADVTFSFSEVVEASSCQSQKA